MDEIAVHLDQSDHGLITNANRIAGRLDVEIKNLEEKVFQAHRKKNQTLRAQVERVAFSLIPEWKMQDHSSVELLHSKVRTGRCRSPDHVACHGNSKVHHLISLE